MSPLPKSPRRPFWLPTVAALLVLALTIAAGIWQTQRAATKRQLQARYDAQEIAPARALTSVQFDPQAWLYRRVSVSGRFDPAHEVLLDNRILDGKPGYEVITPLKLDSGSGYVLIDRGWIAQGLHRATLPEIKTPLTAVRVEGIANLPSGRYLELSKQTVAGKVWENLDFQRMQAQLPQALAPLMVVQLSDSDDGLMRRWQRPDVGLAMHIGYAFQWFALAVATVVIYGVLYVRRRKTQ